MDNPRYFLPQNNEWQISSTSTQQHNANTILLAHPVNQP